MIRPTEVAHVSPNVSTLTWIALYNLLSTTATIRPYKILAAMFAAKTFNGRFVCVVDSNKGNTESWNISSCIDLHVFR